MDDHYANANEMGIKLDQLTEPILVRMEKAERKRYGVRGMTRTEALERETSRLERDIHNQFTMFCMRHKVIVWHSNPVRKSSIRMGLPDYLCLKNNLPILIEFKVLPNKLTEKQKEVFEEIVLCGNSKPYVCVETESGAAYHQAVSLLKAIYHLEE